MGVAGVAGVGVGGCSDSVAAVAPVFPPFLFAAPCTKISTLCLASLDILLTFLFAASLLPPGFGFVVVLGVGGGCCDGLLG